MFASERRRPKPETAKLRAGGPRTANGGLERTEAIAVSVSIVEPNEDLRELMATLEPVVGQGCSPKAGASA